MEGYLVASAEAVTPICLRKSLKLSQEPTLSRLKTKPEAHQLCSAGVAALKLHPPLVLCSAAHGRSWPCKAWQLQHAECRCCRCDLCCQDRKQPLALNRQLQHQVEHSLSLRRLRLITLSRAGLQVPMSSSSAETSISASAGRPRLRLAPPAAQRTAKHASMPSVHSTTELPVRLVCAALRRFKDVELVVWAL